MQILSVEILKSSSQINSALNRRESLKTNLLLAFTAAHELESLPEWGVGYDENVGRDYR
jgi:hypothetical protein